MKCFETLACKQGLKFCVLSFVSLNETTPRKHSEISSWYFESVCLSPLSPPIVLHFKIKVIIFAEHIHLSAGSPVNEAVWSVCVKVCVRVCEGAKVWELSEILIVWRLKVSHRAGVDRSLDHVMGSGFKPSWKTLRHLQKLSRKLFLFWSLSWSRGVTF